MRTLVAVLSLLDGLLAQTFAPPERVALELPTPTTERDGAVCAADLDGDRKLDLLVVVRVAGEPRLFALPSRRAGAPRALGVPELVHAARQPVTTSEGCEAELAPRVGDLDGDGHGDLLVVANPVAIEHRPPAIPGMPAGHRVVAQPVRWFRGGAAGYAPAEPVLAADGKPLLVQDRAQAEAARAAAVEGAGLVQVACLEPRGAAPVDWNDDGRLDLAVQTDTRILVHLATPDGFRAGVEVGDASGPLDVSGELDPWFVDANGDGTLDLLSVQPDASIGLRAGRKVGNAVQFGPPRIVVASNEARAHRRLAVGDWDGDGRLDLLLCDNVREFAPGTDLDQAERERLGRAERALDELAAKLTALNEQAPLLTADALRARRNERDALQAQGEPHRVLVAALRGKRDGRESLRLSVSVCRQRAR